MSEPNVTDLARRLTCEDCGHSASQHEDHDGTEACTEPGCECVEFHSLHLPKVPR